MPRVNGRAFPKMCRHKRSGRAFVIIPVPGGNQKQVYLGEWGSKAAKAEYDRIIARLAASPDRSPLIGSDPIADLTLNELLVRFLKFAEGYYVDAVGQPTANVERIKVTIRKVVELFGVEPAANFGPKALKVVMDAWVKEGLSRKVVNGRSQEVKRIFKWAVGEELLESECYQRLTAVEGLRIGRTTAPDRQPVTPANAEDLAKAMEFLPPPVRALATLQRHCGARAGELVILRPMDIDRSGDIWTYSPPQHKGIWKGKSRTIYFGRACQDVLAPFLLKAGGPTEYLFSPARWELERNAAKSANRVTPKYPSHMRRNAAKRKKVRARGPKDRYTTGTYRRAIERACDRAGVERITPHQLRHLAATVIRSQMGVDVARAMLGHSLASVTEIYSKEVDRELATKGARKLG